MSDIVLGGLMGMLIAPLLIALVIWLQIRGGK